MVRNSNNERSNKREASFIILVIISGIYFSTRLNPFKSVLFHEKILIFLTYKII